MVCRQTDGQTEARLIQAGCTAKQITAVTAWTDGYKQAEIAESMGISRPCVSKLIDRARTKIDVANKANIQRAYELRNRC